MINVQKGGRVIGSILIIETFKDKYNLFDSFIAMETYWIYVIIGAVVLLFIIAGGIWYFMNRNSDKQLKIDLFDGEAYCIVVEKLKDSSSVLGKRKT